MSNLKKGDVVVVPISGAVFIGEVIGEKKFVPDAPDAWSSANRVSVKLICDKETNSPIPVSRKSLRNKLQSRLRIRQTVIYLNEFRDDLAEVKKSLEEQGVYSLSAKFTQAESEWLDKFKAEVNEKFDDGSSYLTAGGQGLEELIKSLLETEGYDAEILSKKGQPDGQDVDIEAVKSGLVTHKLLIQAKHHNGTSGKHGITQLVNAASKDGQKEPNQTITKLFITTAKQISHAAEELAEENNVVVIKRGQFIDWVVDNIDCLNKQACQMLDVLNVPVLVR